MLKKILGFAGKKAFEYIKPKVNVPVTKLEKLKSKANILDQKLKATGAKLKQTQFEIQNPKFKGKDFTFKKDQGKSESKKESYDRIVKENTKVLKGIVDDAFKEKKAKGGRIGLKSGTNPFGRKSNIKKIQEAFGPKQVKKKEKPKARMMAKKGSKPKKKFPDLNKDGKVTFADVLKGRGVINGKKKQKKKII
tara:strand:- start:42 stop:620 length:579 start_codon:yes stop_codon:yes gene_type:complete